LSFTQTLTTLVSSMPLELGIVLLSMIPVAELRFAIPYAIAHDMSPIIAFLLSVIGNTLPIPFIILFIRPIFNYMKRFKILHKLVTKLEEKGEKNKDSILKYEFWGLMIFVAIPLPGTGAWTGALVAAMLDMRLKKAFSSIFLGVVGAGVIVTLASTILKNVIGFFIA